MVVYICLCVCDFNIPICLWNTGNCRCDSTQFTFKMVIPVVYAFHKHVDRILKVIIIDIKD